MSKVKYYYDPDTLSYRKIEPRKSRKFRNIALFFLGSFLFGFLGLTLLLNTNLVNTPRELSLAREVKNYELQFELLGKKMEQIEMYWPILRTGTTISTDYILKPIPYRKNKEELDLEG